MPCSNNTLWPRFWKHVNKRGPLPLRRKYLGRCWVWTGSTNQDGYGQIGTRAGLAMVHRVHWSLKRGPIPPGEEIIHRCDNTRCIRLFHLRPATHAANMRDMVLKGRSRAPLRHPKRLSYQQVLKIRSLWKQGVRQVILAKRFDRQPNTICKIVNGKRWC